MKDWIKKAIGIEELIKEQRETNKLLTEVIKWQRHNINNDCQPPSRRRKAH